jgi:hypothetical protein
MNQVKQSEFIGQLQQHLQHLWERVKHENEMINHRLSWLWTLQGLLFATFGYMLKDNTKTFNKFPISVICLVDIASYASVGYSLWKGRQVLTVLTPAFLDLATHIELSLKLITPSAVEPDALAFLYPWRFLPWAILGAWVALFAWVVLYKECSQ